MPVVNPLLFYPWRAVDFLMPAGRWLRLVRRYRRIMAQVVADPASRSYVDEALRPHSEQNEPAHFVEMFADKIPHTHGAPVRIAAGVAAAGLLQARPGPRVASDPAFGSLQQPADIAAVHDPQQHRQQ
jgi:hypothetical protein